MIIWKQGKENNIFLAQEVKKHIITYARSSRSGCGLHKFSNRGMTLLFRIVNVLQQQSVCWWIVRQGWSNSLAILYIKE